MVKMNINVYIKEGYDKNPYFRAPKKSQSKPVLSAVEWANLAAPRWVEQRSEVGCRMSIIF
jgi:hypothetical protein